MRVLALKRDWTAKNAPFRRILPVSGIPTKNRVQIPLKNHVFGTCVSGGGKLHITTTLLLPEQRRYLPGCNLEFAR